MCALLALVGVNIWKKELVDGSVAVAVVRAASFHHTRLCIALCSLHGFHLDRPLMLQYNSNNVTSDEVELELCVHYLPPFVCDCAVNESLPCQCIGLKAMCLFCNGVHVAARWLGSPALTASTCEIWFTIETWACT